jgi:NADH-quinone oxidoreductase subunit L
VVPLAGFWAKDEILNVAGDHQNWVVYTFMTLSVFITALYMTRLYILTFLGRPQVAKAHDHAHDAEAVMTGPLLLLAGLTLVSGFVVFDQVGEALGFPGGFGEFVFLEEPESFHFPWDVAIISTATALTGIGVGVLAWSREAALAKVVGAILRPAYLALYNKFYIDEAYQWVIDRVILPAGRVLTWFDRNVVNDTAVDGSAGIGLLAGFEMKFLETGKLPNYALAIATGVIVVGVVFLVVRV